jgi:hypothetical protein
MEKFKNDLSINLQNSNTASSFQTTSLIPLKTESTYSPVSMPSTTRVKPPTNFKLALTAARRNFLAEEERKFLIHGRYELSVLETRTLRLAALKNSNQKMQKESENQKRIADENSRKERLSIELKRRRQIILDEKNRNLFIPMNDFCIICNIRPKTNGFLPCGHRCICASCAITSKKICPLCHKTSSNITPMSL